MMQRSGGPVSQRLPGKKTWNVDSGSALRGNPCHVRHVQEHVRTTVRR